jgi:hypothetical protein
MRFSSHLNRCHYGLLHLLRGAEVVADSLTCMHCAMVKCLFVADRSCIPKGSYITPEERRVHAVDPPVHIHRS